MAQLLTIWLRKKNISLTSLEILLINNWFVMTQDASISLSGFMKKKFNEKSCQNRISNHSQVKNRDGEEKERKRIRVAKNESNQKAANYNKFEMYKKMIIQCVIGYLAMLTAVVILVLACVLIGPAVMSFFQVIINKLVLSALHA